MRRGAVAQLGECLTGSQEVASSILASSTNRINNLRALPLLPPCHFPPTFADCLPIFYIQDVFSMDFASAQDVQSSLPKIPVEKIYCCSVPKWI
jgi:hypothetical protein